MGTRIGARFAPRFPLRSKFFLFAVLISAAPLLLVGQNLVRIARDELKSAANEQLAAAASQVAFQIDGIFADAWMAPLLLLRNAIDNPALDLRQKVSLLEQGLADVPDALALQLTVGASDLPILLMDAALEGELRRAGVDPAVALKMPLDQVVAIVQDGAPEVSRLPGSGTWTATMALPLATQFSGQTLILSARFDLGSLARLTAMHPLSRRGEVIVVDATGATLMESAPRDLTDREIVLRALRLIDGSGGATGAESYVRTDGTAMLGAYAYPSSFRWAVVTELEARDAYGIVDQMMESLTLWVTVGFIAAAGAATLFAHRLTRPILAIGEVARRVGQGDFTARVEHAASRDEIGDLAQRVNTMIGELNERLELMKFVSQGTVSAVQSAGAGGVRLGGQRLPATMLFSDIRGYTAFAETVDPETVVEVLNVYLDEQARIVEAHGGDVDKFVGDQVVAVFQGPEMERRAVACALEIQAALSALLRDRPAWNLHVGIGVHSGEIVQGALGSRNRMDFTVLGDAVNVAARLCSAAAPDVVLVTGEVRERAAGAAEFAFETLAPITVKGKTEPIPVYAATLAGGRMRSEKETARAEPRAPETAGAARS